MADDHRGAHVMRDLPRGHPIRCLMDAHAYAGSVPTDAELEALGIPESHARRLRSIAKRAAEIHATGAQKDAWDYGAALTDELVGSMPERFHAANYNAKPEPEITDYAEHAAKLPKP